MGRLVLLWLLLLCACTGRAQQGPAPCLGLPRLLSPLLSMLFQPDSRTDVDTRLLLHSWDAAQPWELRATDFQPGGLPRNAPAPPLPDFDPRRRTFVIVHGFLSSGRQAWVTAMARALLHAEDANVAVVDWSGGSNTLRYWRAVANAPVAAEDTALLLQQLPGLRRHQLHCIGHSLGAHVCASVAKRLGGIGRLTGLDPAQPCFRPEDPEHVHLGDAAFVDVIHTNGQPLRRLGLGLAEPMGHVDFFPNGGKVQPGCLRWEYPLLLTDMLRSICSHGRANLLFIESIGARNCTFWGRRWDRHPDSMRTALAAPCDLQRCAEMGLRADRSSARGSFYVRTSAKAPFCLPQPETEERMRRLMAADLSLSVQQAGQSRSGRACTGLDGAL